MFSTRRPRNVAPFIAVMLLLNLLIQAGCGPEDYQTPIQGFEAASATVITAMQKFLVNENLIEQNTTLDDLVFEHKPLNLPEIDKIEIISPEEIAVRTDALNALAQYTANLAVLAQGKPSAAVGDNTKQLSSSLKALAEDVQKLPATKTTFLHNAQFGGLVSNAANAVGAVAQLIVERKARRQLEQSIIQNDPAVTALIDQISIDAQGAYLRQENQMGAYGTQLSKDYDTERKGNADPALLLTLATAIKNYRAAKSQLAGANPAPAITKMKKAHEALVAYVKSSKSPRSLSQLVKAVREFVLSVQPLGEAVQGLAKAS